MDLPQKRSRFSEEKLKIIQEFYKQMPQLNPNPAMYPYMIAPDPMPIWPHPPQQQQQHKTPTSANEKLKNYIARAFTKCQTDIEKDLMETFIRDIITRKKNAGLFFQEDWDKTEIPKLPREQVTITAGPSLEVPKIFQPSSKDQIQKRKSRFEPIELVEDSKPRNISKEQNIDEHNKEKIKKEILSEWKIIGTCKELEKPFFRLTSKPDPKTIRPESVLKKALAWLKERWRKGEIKYEYFSDQLRSIRQDLTVQGIRNKFSVEIYQAHTRLALEAQDLDQYNSCMSRLFELYKEGLPGRVTEFKAYQIMYFTFQHLYIQLEKCLKALNGVEKKSPEIKQAMEFKRAILLGNYHQVFHIRPNLMNSGNHLLDIFMPKLRVLSLLKICKAYQPSISVDILTKELGFNHLSEAEAFILENGGVIEAGYLECRPSLLGLRKSSLIQTKT
ncbi:hypothetical protein SteCoe_16681 [Stentor coeruleus]|uniref:SAC3/GANP/THP3 conserved domain-containing protein n=1 Tax=Stentor coeruleus TaxID=5963 RepID=A0A1R2C0L9_9CILI|nr:hypothetical protein SteCoe_16681 [Stentor coeruleus]